MRKIKRLILKSIFIMLLVFLGIGLLKGKYLVVYTGNGIENGLKDVLKDKYYTMYDYKQIGIPFNQYSIVFPKYSDMDDAYIPALEGTQEEIFQKAISYMKQYTYTKYNPSLDIMNLTGEGNCQALSVMFKFILDKYGISNEIVGSDSHVYNEVIVDGTTYTVDFSNGSLELKE